MTLNRLSSKWKKICRFGNGLQWFWNTWIAPRKAGLLFGFLGLQFFILFFAFVRHYQLSDLASLKGAELAAQEHDNRTLLLQMLTGCAVLVGMYIAWVRAKATESQARATQSTAEAAYENVKTLMQGQISERFTKAIEHLGHDKIEIRLGGIYALERIMKDSNEDHWTIVEILAAYIRKRSPWPRQSEIANPNKYLEGKISASPNDIQCSREQAEYNICHSDFAKLPGQDIQSALSVIVRRPQNRTESGQIDLRSVDLRGLDFRNTDGSGGYLPRAIMQYSNVSGANLSQINFQHAELEGANMTLAVMCSANLKGAQMENSILKKANLENACLYRAYMRSANLQLATITKANMQETYLQKADLQNALLKETNLQGAILHRANLQKTRLDGANLQGASFVFANLESAVFHAAWLKEAEFYELKFATSSRHNLMIPPRPRGLTAEQLSTALTVAGAKIPPTVKEKLLNLKPELFEDPLTRNLSP